MTSKRQQNAGFLLPNPVTGYDTVCLTLQIPNVREYRAAIVGHLFKLANWWSWEKSYIGNDTRAKQAADMWRRLLVDTLRIDECDSGGTPEPMATCRPIGDFVFRATPEVPEGCLPMLGGTFLQADYPDLMPTIPTDWKSGDNFTLPDMTSRGPVGANFQYLNSGGLPLFAEAGDTGGEISHQLLVSELAEHRHTFSMRSQGFGGSGGVGVYTSGATFNTSYVGGNMPHNNMQPFLAGFWFIQALECGSGGTPGSFDIRLSGCLLEYTLNGSMWFVVDGWTNYDNCLAVPLPFDLRFNNCLLEYSRDSAQTWDTVPGWLDAAACIDTDTPYDLRFQDGLLQWSKDGGQDWATVDGWSTGITEVITEKDRCLNAWGLTERFCQLAAMMVQPLTLDPILDDYTDHCATVWYAEFPEPEGLPDALQQFVVQSFNVALRDEFIAKFENLLKQEIVARYFYTAAPNGEWCDENITTLLNWLLCDPGVTEDHVISVILLFQALLSAHDGSYGTRSKFRAYLYQLRDYGTCQDCAELLTVEPCTTGGPFSVNWDFSEVQYDWEILTDQTCWALTANGIDTTGKYSACLEDYRTDIIMQIPINSDCTFASVTGVALSLGGLSSMTMVLQAFIGSTWVTIDTDSRDIINQPFTVSGAIPTGASSIKLRAYTPGSAGIAVSEATIAGDGTNPF